MPGKTRRTRTSKINKSLWGIHQKKYLQMMIIKNLLIFSIDICVPSKIQTGLFKYLKELDGSSLRQLSRLTGFTVNKIFRA